MAANRASAQQGLTIALIVFVMLTFILAVTTYLFFKKAADADAAMAVANADSAKSKQEMQKAAGDRAKLLGILGFPEEKPVQEVETETNEAFEKKYGDFRDDQKAYLKLSDWLLGAVKSKDDALKTLQAEKLAMETSKDQALADSRNRQNELEQLLKKQEADAEAERAEFNNGREQYEKLTAMLQADLKKANEASDRIKLLIEEIAKGEPLVAVDQQAKYKAAKAEGQVGQLYDELRRRETMIARQNEILADLRMVGSIDRLVDFHNLPEEGHGFCRVPLLHGDFAETMEADGHRGGRLLGGRSVDRDCLLEEPPRLAVLLSEAGDRRQIDE